MSNGPLQENYIIEYERSPKDLMRVVNRRLYEGYVLNGGMFALANYMGGTYFYQALVKQKPDTTYVGGVLQAKG